MCTRTIHLRGSRSLPQNAGLQFMLKPSLLTGSRRGREKNGELSERTSAKLKNSESEKIGAGRGSP